MANEDNKNETSCSTQSSDKGSSGFSFFKTKNSCSTKRGRNSCSTGNCPSGSCSNNNTMLLVVIAAVMLMVAYRTRSSSEDVQLEATTATQEVVSVESQAVATAPAETK